MAKQASPRGLTSYQDARFGMFIHWGLYALIGRGEWIMHLEQIPVAEYEQMASQFNPVEFDADQIEMVNTPYQAPNANAVVERWVRSVREECLNRLIILNARHLRRGLQEYTTYYNARRPHQSLEQDSPLGLESGGVQGPIRCRHVLGGIIRDYYREAA